MPSNETMFTLVQALQLVGLAPCVFVVLLLAFLVRRNRQVILPAAYFLSLACAFTLPLLDVFFPLTPHTLLTAVLLAGESMLAALAFLMILQFMQGQVPKLPYWLVLAIPLIGGGVLVYASLVQGDCLHDMECTDIESARTLYNVFGSSLVFLLLIYYISRFSGFAKDDVERRHKYALILALIAIHLLVLAVELAQLEGIVKAIKAFSIETVFRLTFIYLAMTSLFRVFYPSLIREKVVMVPVAHPYDPEQDVPHVQTLQVLLDSGIHREMRLNRAALAKKVGIGEHHLSRVINHHFNKSFNDLINDYRIEEAKRRLKNEPTQITTIAFEIGFNSIASFNRVFKTKVGVSPTEYRANNPSQSYPPAASPSG
jgi:AraC-like DNA-binding protein